MWPNELTINIDIRVTQLDGYKFIERYSIIVDESWIDYESDNPLEKIEEHVLEYFTQSWPVKNIKIIATESNYEHKGSIEDYFTLPNK